MSASSIWRRLSPLTIGTPSSHPAAEAELAEQAARLFGRVALMSGALLTLRFLWIAATGDSRLPVAALNLAVHVALFIPAWALVQRGRLEAGAALALIGFSLYAGLWIIPRTGGMLSPALPFQLVLVALSAVLGGKRVAAGVVLCALGGAAAMVLSPTPTPAWMAGVQTNDPLSLFGMWSSFIAAMGLVGWLYADGARALVARSRETRAEFQSVFETSPMALLIARHDPVAGSSRMVDINPAAERLLGRSRADFAGLLRTEAPEAIVLSVEQARAADEAARLGLPLDLGVCSMLVRHGSSRCVVATARPTRWMGASCSLWTIEDVTDLIRARQAAERSGAALSEINQDLERRVEERGAVLSAIRAEMAKSESLASLGSLVAGVSHELNTPIGNALLAASALRNDVAGLRFKVDGGAIRRSEINNFIERSTRASSLIEESLLRSADLLGRFKQSASDRSSMSRRGFDLGECAADALALLRPSLDRLGRAIQVSLQPCPQVLLDSYPGAVGQIVSNLVNNAMLHAFDDARSGGAITLSVFERGGLAVLAVDDDGRGIDPVLTERVFEPFFTTKLGRGGTGLGLSISAGLARDILGGQLLLAPRANGARGARFELAIPRSAPDAGLARAEALR